MASIVEGKRRGAENAHQERAWLAWTIAALQRAKRLPALTEIAVFILLYSLLMRVCL